MLLHRPGRRLASALMGAALLPLAALPASAEVPVQQTFFKLPSSNGHTAVLVDLSLGKMTHFREHLAGSEEPLLDAAGNEVWIGNQPQMVRTRDVLYDAFFGIRAEGDQRWLPGIPVEYDVSGYAGYAPGKNGGTGVVKMVQKVGSLTTTQYFFAPQGLPHAGFVMAMLVKNTGAAKVSGVSAFSLHNYHLGTGRPNVMDDIGEDGETVVFDNAGGEVDFIERAFAGVVVTRALAPVSRHGANSAGTPAAQKLYDIVDDGGTANLPDFNGTSATADGWITGYQYDLGDLDPGESAWVGVAAAHHADPFADATVEGWLDAYVAGKSASVLVNAEIDGWKTFQDGLNTPAGVSGGEVTKRHKIPAGCTGPAQVEDASTWFAPPAIITWAGSFRSSARRLTPSSRKGICPRFTTPSRSMPSSRECTSG